MKILTDWLCAAAPWPGSLPPDRDAMRERPRTETPMELQDLSWLCLVGLFLASLVIVLVWLIQYSLSLLRLRRGKRAAATTRQTPFKLSHRTRTGGVWGVLLQLRFGRDGGQASEAGVQGLLASLFSFKSFREHWQSAWVRALNEQACRHGSSIQITFDNSLQLTASAAIESVTCTDQSANSMVLQCRCGVDTVTFPVTVTQQSPAAVSMDTYLVTTEPSVAQLEVCLEEVQEEGLQVSWTLSQQCPLVLTVSPRRQHRQGSDGEVDLDMIRALVEDTLYSTQPAMILNLKTCVSSPTCPVERLPGRQDPPSQSLLGGQTPPSQRLPGRRLLLRNLRASCHIASQWSSRPAELCCVLTLDQPSADKRTRFLPVPSSPGASLEWGEDITLDLGAGSREVRVRLMERSSRREQFLPGQASIALDLPCKVPIGQHVLSVSPGHGLAPVATVTLELCEAPWSSPNTLPLRSSLTPTKKVDVDRTIMPDGTIVTTVTTIQSRPKLDRKPGDSPMCSPSKVEVTEKGPTVLSDSRSSISPASSSGSPISNGLDPVAETAIRQLTESACKVARKTPTKRSTLIISGVSKVPIAEDDCALSLSYAASMDAALHNNHQGAGGHQDPDETTPSDASERPSVDDVESDTGSTGALETRSLKDHKVGFLQSGTRLWFRRRQRNSDGSCFSHSHDDVSNLGSDDSATASSSATAATPSASGISRKKSGSFSRRLIKRFSFKRDPSGKAKGKGANGGASASDN